MWEHISNTSTTMSVQTVSALATQKATKVVGLCKTFPRVRAFASRQSNDTAIKIMIMAINKLFSLNLIIIQGISFFFVLIKTHYTLLQYNWSLVPFSYQNKLLIPMKKYLFSNCHSYSQTKSFWSGLHNGVQYGAVENNGKILHNVGSLSQHW